VVADEQYIRESILRPTAKIVAGYEPIMPVYQGRINEEDMLQLVAYIKSLAPANAQAPASPAAAATPATGASATGAPATGAAGQAATARGTAAPEDPRGGAGASTTGRGNETSGNK
jgi:hypothetical protein